MNAFALASGRVVLAASLITVALAACGRRGALEPPPDPVAIAAQKQRDEQRRQRQGGAAAATPAGSGVIVGQTQVGPLGQTNRLEGNNPPPGDDDEEDRVPSIVPAPVPSSATGRRRGYVIPKEPFILDPLL